MPLRSARSRLALLTSTTLALVVTAMGLQPLAASAATSTVAQLTVYTDGTSVGTEGVGGLAQGHSFLGFKNTSRATIVVGELKTVQPGETVTLGTWGNKSEHAGLWYNLESYFIKKDLAAYATASLSISLTASQLKIIDAAIVARDSYNAITNNCSSFATAMWNRVASTKMRLSARSVLTAGVDSPTGLMTSIESKPGYQVGMSSSIPWSGRGVLFGQKLKAPKASTEWVIDPTPPVTTPPATTGSLTDPGLKACVIAQLAQIGVVTTSPTTAQLGQLTRLNCDSSYRVGSLDGLQSATALTNLSTTGSASDLTPIAKLPALTDVSISGSADGKGVTSLAPLNGNTVIRNLGVVSSPLTDPSPLMTMTNLSNVTLNEDHILNITSLSNATFRWWAWDQRVVLPPTKVGVVNDLPVVIGTQDGHLDPFPLVDSIANSTSWDGVGGGTVTWNAPGTGTLQWIDGRTDLCFGCHEFAYYVNLTQQVTN